MIVAFCRNFINASCGKVLADLSPRGKGMMISYENLSRLVIFRAVLSPFPNCAQLSVSYRQIHSFGTLPDKGST